MIRDEPEIAQRNLAKKGIRSKIALESSAREVLSTIASSTLFIGSMSQFLIVDSLLCAYLGGKPCLLATAYGE